MSSWKIKKMSGHCGARLEGVSLSNASNSDLEEMRSALFEYGVIVMPDQNLSPEDHLKLAEFFGPVDVNRFFTPVASHPMIAEVRTSAEQTEVIGGTWHTDHSYDGSCYVFYFKCSATSPSWWRYAFCFNVCSL